MAMTFLCNWRNKVAKEHESSADNANGKKEFLWNSKKRPDLQHHASGRFLLTKQRKSCIILMNFIFARFFEFLPLACLDRGSFCVLRCEAVS